MRYDRARKNLDMHPKDALAVYMAYLAGLAACEQRPRGPRERCVPFRCWRGNRRTRRRAKCRQFGVVVCSLVACLTT